MTLSEIIDADGRKLVQGNVQFLVEPSRDYLRRVAQDSLRRRSLTTDTATFPQGRWERVNDYAARTRSFQEFDAEVGGNVVGTITERISDDEVAAQLNQDEWTGIVADIEAITTVVEARTVLRRISRYISRRDQPDTPVPSAVIFGNDVSGNVGQTVSVPLIMEAVPSSGLAGYALQATIRDGATARFVDVQFPAVFSLNSHTPDPVSGARLSLITGVNVTNAVVGGSQNVTLCTLRVELLSQGRTDIFIGNSRVDDDNGFPIDIGVRSPTVTVR